VELKFAYQSLKESEGGQLKYMTSAAATSLSFSVDKLDELNAWIAVQIRAVKATNSGCNSGPCTFVASLRKQLRCSFENRRMKMSEEIVEESTKALKRNLQ
jgi:hypothetical protein